MIGFLLPGMLLLQQFSAPEGPDGLVYNKNWPTLRLATKRQGKWDAWKFGAYPGNGGQPVTLSAVEAAQVEGHLKKIAEVIESTPYAQAQRGWYAARSVGWIRTRFPAPGFPVAKLPVESYYTLYPFHLMDKQVVRNGVKEWAPDWSQETKSIRYGINGSLVGLGGEQIYREEESNGNTLIWYADPQPGGEFHGLPVYGGDVVIGRKGRPLFRAVRLKRALEKFLPLYREDWKTAEDRMRGLQQKLAETEGEAFAREAMEEFEKEYGSWKSTRPRDYEHRRKVRLGWVDRTRQEAREQATPKEGTAEGAWYWEPKRALEAMERLAQTATGTEAACFEMAAAGSGLYRSRGYLRVDGAGTKCKRVMEANPDYYDGSLARTTPQLIRVGGVTQCIDVKTKTPVVDSLGGDIPHGCTVHRAIWEQMDWQKLAAIVAP